MSSVNRRAGWSVWVASIGVLAILIVATAACGPEPAAVSPDRAPSSTPTTTFTLSPTPTNAPEPSVNPSPIQEPPANPSPAPDPPAPPLRAPDPAGRVRANALGRLSGNWVFVGKQVPYPHNIWAEVQVWAIPLAAGVPRVAFAYDVSLGGVPEAIFDNAPYLRRQFSPDGTRVVVSVNGGLVVVDLTSGQVQPLGVSGYFPSWSKDGSRIAYLFYLPVDQVVPPEEAIFVVAASGGPAKEIARVGYRRQSVEWSPDGSMLLVAQPDGMAIVDAANGKVVRRLTEVASYGSSFAQWTLGTPQITIASGDCDQTTTKLVGLDDVTAPVRTLLDTDERCPTLTVQDPRWNPASPRELLYVATRAQPGAMPHDYRAHLFDIRSGRDTTLPLSAYEATWTWDGAKIVYIAKSATGFYGDAVRLWPRDGSDERVLVTAGANEFFFSLASLSY